MPRLARGGRTPRPPRAMRRAAAQTRATARAQRRLDRRQRRRARRDVARRQRRDRWWRRWVLLRPYALATLALLAFITAGASTGLLLDAATRALGVTLVVGGLCATAGLLALEWRISGGE